MNDRSRNAVLDWIKLIAACLVVFIHCPFPGNSGIILDTLARVAVPLFFAVSGYYCYRATRQQIIGRFTRVLKILVITVCIYLAWQIWKTRFVDTQSVRALLAQVFSLRTLASVIIININPLAGHIWYLIAIAECYLCYLLYTDFWGENVNHSYLYTVSFLLFIFQLAFGVFSQRVSLDIQYTIYRNTLFFGIPMFSMGIFLNQYRERIVSAYHLSVFKGILIASLGAAFSLVQRFGIGKVELPIGTLIEVIAIMLLVFSYPVRIDSNKRFIRRLTDLAGNMTLTVYVIHPLFIYIVKAYSNRSEMMAQIVQAEHLFPLIVLCASLATGIILYCLKQLFAYCFTHFHIPRAGN